MDGLDIYRFYLGAGYNVGHKMRSPLPTVLRKKDNHPSFSTYLYNGTICWNDFGYDSPYGNGPIGFVAAMELTNREGAIEIIKNKGFSRSTRPMTIFDKVDTAKINLTFTPGDLSYQHYEYYRQLFVDNRLLGRFKVRSLVSVMSGLNHYMYKATDDNFGFYMKIGKGNKGYIPFNLSYTGKPKVLHQGIDVLEGYEFLPAFGKLLIITKSFKDVLFLTACGYNAICCSSESSLNIFVKFAYELSERFEEIIVWGDPDKTGRAYGAKIKRLIPKAKIAESIIAKDPSDIGIVTSNKFYINLIIDRARAC